MDAGAPGTQAAVPGLRNLDGPLLCGCARRLPESSGVVDCPDRAAPVPAPADKRNGGDTLRNH
eukprot:6943771-Lingulodinium_polyedra.AAC.1